MEKLDLDRAVPKSRCQVGVDNFLVSIGAGFGWFWEGVVDVAQEIISHKQGHELGDTRKCSWMVRA